MILISSIAASIAVSVLVYFTIMATLVSKGAHRS